MKSESEFSFCFFRKRKKTIAVLFKGKLGLKVKKFDARCLIVFKTVGKVFNTSLK